MYNAGEVGRPVKGMAYAWAKSGIQDPKEMLDMQETRQRMQVPQGATGC